MLTSTNLKPVIALTLLVLVLSTGIVLAENATDSPGSGLSEMSLEELLDVKITSVSKKSERPSEAAAIYVLTGDEIRQSGVTNIPDALRMVPGLHIANIDASTWAVSARGFNANFSNKLLVLIDGRTVYTAPH